MGVENKSFVVTTVTVVWSTVWGLMKFVGRFMALAMEGEGSAESSQKRTSDGSVRIEVFNPCSRRWSFAGNCIHSDGAIEAAMQRAMKLLSFSTKVRAVDSRSGVVVNFMER